MYKKNYFLFIDLIYYFGRVYFIYNIQDLYYNSNICEL